MAPLRIAVVADVLLTELGGVGRSVLGVAGSLAELDPERARVELIARRHPPAIDGLPFRRSFSPRVPVFPNSIFAVQRPFTLRGFDVVHYMDGRPPLTFALGRAPSAVTEHGFAPLLFEEDYPRPQKLLNAVLLRLLPRADLVVTPSKTERRELLARARLDPERVVAIHHGVDHDRFHPLVEGEEARALVRSRVGFDGPFVLCVANHQSKKNLPRLVQAFDRIAPELPDLRLVLTGWHTPRFAAVRTLIDGVACRSRIAVLGHVGDEILRPLYATAAAFVLPSLHESFGLPALEAMACGAPVVSSSTYSLPEVCGDAAEYVDPSSVDSIAEGMLRVLSNPARAAELRQAGLRRAAGFTWRAAAERHLEAYERVLDVPRAAAPAVTGYLPRRNAQAGQRSSGRGK